MATKKKANSKPQIPQTYVAKVDDLIPYARNSRTHTDDQVAKVAASIQEFGFLAPVITDGDNGIIAGHCRIEAARKIGLEQVPAVEASHLTDSQKKAYIIADNRIALDAGWNEQMLQLELQDIAEADMDMTITGFTHDELAEIFDYSPVGDEDGEKQGAGDGGNELAEFTVQLAPEDKSQLMQALDAISHQEDLTTRAECVMAMVHKYNT